MTDGYAPAYQGRRVVVTGGLGFIGSNLARWLVRAGAKVTLLDSLIPEYGGNSYNVEDFRGEVTVNICDVRDPHGVRYLLRGADFVFNLAGQTSHLDSMADPFTDLAINASAQLSLLESCRIVSPEAKVVFASTRQLYGRPQYLPVDENHPVHPVDVNGINKWAGEAYHILYNEVHGLRTSVLRLTNTYGPGMRVKDARQTFLGIWLRKAIEGKPFAIFGDGSQLRDLNYVDDVVRAMLMAGSSAEADGRIFNLGSDEVVSLRQLGDIVTESQTNATYELVPFPSERKAIDVGDYYGDFSLVERTLGWRPKVALRTGIRTTLDFYAANSSHYWEHDD